MDEDALMGTDLALSPQFHCICGRGGRLVAPSVTTFVSLLGPLVLPLFPYKKSPYSTD